MTERIRINRIKLDATLSGKPVVHLHAPGAQYAQFPVLYLFNAGLLAAVGIDPNGLEPGEDIHVNLWAHFEVSEKLNSKGNPYKDVISLERVDALATTTSTDTTEILGELRAIKALLLNLATSSPSPATERIRTLNHVGSAKDPQAPPEVGQATEPEPTPTPELTEAEARTEFYELTGPAIIAGADPQAINDLTALANGSGWNEALVGLKELLAN